MNYGNWKTLQFEELAADTRNAIVGGPFGSNLVSADYADTGVPVIRGQNLGNGRWVDGPFAFVSDEKADALRANWARPGDIVFTQRGTLGQVAIVPEGPWDRYVVSQSQMKATVNAQFVDALFVYYYFTNPVEHDYIVANAIQTGVPHSNLGQLRAHPMRLPSLKVQRAISAVLGALDDKIEQNRLAARILERLARAIFRAWFVDFEPVRAKADGATSFPSMPKAVFDGLPTRFIDTEIGNVPEGWRAGTIAHLATQSKAQINPQESPEEEYEHFSIPAYDAGKNPIIELGAAIKSNKFSVVRGSVLLSKLNPRIARVWLPPREGERRRITSTEFLVFVPKEAPDRHYLYCQFQESGFRDSLAQSASGTSNSHQRVRPDDVANRSVILPPGPMREAFAASADPLFDLAASNHEESRKLATMRDYLLPKLLSGQVRVEAVNG